MKANDVYILTGTVAYSYLFYSQNPGINFFLFSLLMVVLFFISGNSLALKRSWLAVASGTVVSGFFVFWWGTKLTVLANICSLAILAGLSFNTESSLLIAAFNTGVSVLTSIPRFFAMSLQGRAKETGGHHFLRKSMLFLIPLVVSLVFVSVYRAANPIFEQFTNQINFDFISVDWCIFTGMAFFVMVGFFKYFVVTRVHDEDMIAADDLPVINEEMHLLSAPALSVSNEIWTGVILLAMLNIVLLCVNGLDVFYMWIAAQLPKGVSLVSYVHDGANTLIFSILMAIAVILFVFRGHLSFYEKNGTLKTLACIWIAQNALLVITTANRNWLLIDSSGLTRRRIGVYVYLLLCLVGLTSTLIKVIRRKSNWFLFRKNGWAFYAVFIISCFINWDALIVNYNCKKGNDRLYQASLTHTGMAYLFRLYAGESRQEDKSKSDFTPFAIQTMNRNYQELKMELETSGWQSYCVSKKRNFDEATSLIKAGEVPAP